MPVYLDLSKLVGRGGNFVTIVFTGYINTN